MTEHEIVLAAIEKTDPQERASYLDQVCQGDTTLRQRVNDLLQSHEREGRQPVSTEPTPATRTMFLDAGTTQHPSSEDDTVDLSPNNALAAAISRGIAEGAGTQIGSYTLREKLGEGGMGVVYRAEQNKPVKREIALKIIKPGMDTEQVVARFEAERQALAIMDHTSIAKVFDAGATDSGRPYFVMELVKGVPITEYCDTAHLSPRQRLELFIPVCAAVQHAHQKGIIHRDLKPSNVLVAMQDGKPVPKVIDFGIAKATEQKLTERSLFTQHGAIVGTLEYMSPEQAGMDSTDIDTRTDVYALGVMLYELLTGTTPLERARLRQAGYAEILKRIKEEDPPKPSTRLSGSGDALPSVAALRGIEPARLTRLVRGDLDWIVMKALEKDRTRRYETANGFARDIQRHLDGDPVEASPPSRSYRLKKFARKHRIALATAAAFALLLVVATATSLGLALWANRERGRAVAAELSARQQQTRAEQREETAIAAVQRFSDTVAQNPELKNNPALESLRKDLLKEPMAFLRTLRDQLQADHDTRPESLARLARASFNLGVLSKEIGDRQDALAAYLNALAIRKGIVHNNPTVAEFQSDLAASHNNLAILLSESGKTDQAMQEYRLALAIRKMLAQANPAVTQFRSDLAGTYNNIGILLGEIGQVEDSSKAYLDAVAIRKALVQENPTVAKFQSDLAASHNNLALLLSETGKTDQAMEAHRLALAIRKMLVQANPTSTVFQINLAASHNNIASLLDDLGQTNQALQAFRDALAIRKTLAQANPTVTNFQSELSASHNNVGVLLGRIGQTDQALKAFREALDIRKALVLAHPAVTEFQERLSSSYNNIGLLLGETGNAHEALEAHRLALAIRKTLAEANPTILEFQSDLAHSHDRVGASLHNLGMIQDASEAYHSALSIRKTLAQANPTIIKFQSDLANCHYAIGMLHREAGKLDEAFKAYHAALDIQKTLAEANPTILEFQSDLAESHTIIGLLLSDSGKLDEALTSHLAALAIQKSLAETYPQSSAYASSLGGTFNNIALLDAAASRYGDARARLEEAVRWQRKALAMKPNHPRFRRYLANHLSNLRRTLVSLGDPSGLAEVDRELDQLRESDPETLALSAMLDAVIQGKREPGDETQRLSLAQRAYDRGQHVVAVKLWSEALAANSDLGEDRRLQLRYNAACSATMAGCGQSQDDPAPDDAAREKLRQQARTWLTEELTAWKRVALTAGAGNKEAVAQTLAHWQADADLAGIREEASLAKLPDEERAECAKLWADVVALLTRVKP